MKVPNPKYHPEGNFFTIVSPNLRTYNLDTGNPLDESKTQTGTLAASQHSIHDDDWCNPFRLVVPA